MRKTTSGSSQHYEAEVATRNPEETLQRIFDGIADGVLEATDEEILAESREQGRDPLKEAEEVRRVLLDAVKAIAPEAEPRRQRVRRAGTA